VLHTANKIMSWVPTYEGIMPFRPNDNTEHPNINYRSMPVHALFELRQMVSELEDRLQDVHCPALVLQADQDPVVDPESANIVMEKLGSSDKRLEIISSKRHGTLYEDIGDTRKLILDFLRSLSV